MDRSPLQKRKNACFVPTRTKGVGGRVLYSLSLTVFASQAAQQGPPMTAGTHHTICLVLKTVTAGCQEIQVILCPGDSASHSDTFANKGMEVSPLFWQGFQLITCKGKHFCKHLIETVLQEVQLTPSTKASISVGALPELRAGIPLKVWLQLLQVDCQVISYTRFIAYETRALMDKYQKACRIYSILNKNLILDAIFKARN